MSQEISILIQNYQGTFILDLLNEFRKDVIRCIFRDMVVPSDANNQRAAQTQHAEALKAFLSDSSVSDWEKAFASWLGQACPKQVKCLYTSLQTEAKTFISQYSGKPKSQTWAYLYSEDFSGKLRISAGDGQTPAAASLAGLFNVVALSIDRGNIKLIQPPDITLSGGFHTLRCCFPILETSMLEGLARQFTAGDFLSLPLETAFSASPAIRRGHTAVCYNTGYYKHDAKGKTFLNKSRNVFNTCFLQVRPIVDNSHISNPVGFIQLQCCLPGLMEVLVPKKLCHGRNVLLLEDGKLVAKQAYAGDPGPVVLTEFADNWLESDKDKQELCAFWRLSELSHGWLRRLYNFLELSKLQAEMLEKELHRRDQERYRQRLELMDKQIGQMLDAVTVLQKSSSEVRAIVRDPSDAIFGIHPLVAPLFDENSGGLKVASDFSAHIEHQPSNYQETNPQHVRSLRSVMALLLLRWTGNHDDTTKQTYIDSIAGTISWLDACEENEALKPLLSLIKRVLVRSEGNGSPPPVIPRLSEILTEAYPFTALRQGACAAKCLLFTPFKLAADELGLLPIAVALGLNSLKVVSNAASTLPIADEAILEKKLSLNPERSPAMPRDIIQFLLGVVGEAGNRKKAARVTTAEVTTRTTEQQIKIDFAEDYLTGATGTLKLDLRKLLQVPRDWRIEFGASGNFSSPYMRLVSRLLGVGAEWRTLTRKSDLLALKAASHKFTITLQTRAIIARWGK